MFLQKVCLHKVILVIIGLTILIMGIVGVFIPPALSCDPSQAFQVLRSMQLGNGFNNLATPDQGDISKTYTEFFTWWSPGQYLVPYFFKIIACKNLGQGIAVTITIAELSGLVGLYCFFKKIGFTKNIAAISLIFIISQKAFVTPFVFYNGGEVLLFSFVGWFLYGCMMFRKPGLKMLLFIVFSGFIGFFLKSSFLWIYAAGLFCLWIRLSSTKERVFNLIKKGIWVIMPAVITVTTTYIFYISRGESPATISYGFKIKTETFSYPLASPILSGFSVDDLVHGLIEHNGEPLFNQSWSAIILVASGILSLLLIYNLIRFVPQFNYRLFLICFYVTSIMVFGFAYWHQLDISMDSRHFRIIGLLTAPGVVYLGASVKLGYRILIFAILTGIGFSSFIYLIHGYKINNILAKGITGIAQTNIDQVSLDKIMELDMKSSNLTFVLIGDDTVLEILNNNIIPLLPIGDDRKINVNEYTYEGHAGPLYIILPKSYKGVKERMILKSFPGYKDFNESRLSDNYILYVAH